MKLIAFVIAVVVAVIVIMKLRGSSRPAARPASTSKTAKVARSTAPQSSNRFRAVSLQCDTGACDAALALGNKRFLPADLGPLPLADCNSPKCNCTYVHHDDRRSAEGDKRAPSALSTDLYHTSGKPERRTRKGRRESDFR